MELLPFNFTSLSNGQWLLTNESGAFFYLSHRKLLESLIDCNFDGLDKNIIDCLVANNFLSPKGEAGIRSNILASRLSTQISRAITPPSLFMIIPTLRCDHDCGYCQVSRVPIDKVGYDSDLNKIDLILNAIKRIAHGDIKIEFQGGEPLLFFDYIKLFYNRAEEILKNIDVCYVICTATGPLDESIIDWAKNKRVDFSISLDGPAVVHNINRPSRFFDPYAITINSIRIIQRVLGYERVGCLSTISKHSLGYPCEIVDSYLELGLSSIFLRPLSPFGFAAKTVKQIGYDVNEYMAFYKEALTYIISLNSDRIFVEDAALIHLRKIFQPEKSGYVDLQSPSGYAYGALVFNYDGNVFGADEARMLWQATKSEELVLGDLKQSAEKWYEGRITAQILKSSFSCVSPGCVECAYLPYCGSDPMHHLATQGESMGDKSVSFFCQYQKAMFDLLFTLWKTDTNAKRTFEIWLKQ